MKISLSLLTVVVVGCHADPPTPSSPRTEAGSPAELGPRTQPATPHVRDPRIPAASGDYSSVLADVEQYRSHAISFDELQSRTLARALPRHPLGCAYLMTPVPMPPPGVPFDAWMMPKDWEHNWGEVAMTYWVGRLSAEDHAKLHAAAHPGERLL